jgi:hypothetical protein
MTPHPSRQSSALGRYVVVVIAGGLLAAGCGGATRSASPQSPGTAALTGAQVSMKFQRVLVAEKGVVAMVGRNGCVATVSAATDDRGDVEEMRVRCPRPERLVAWFASVDPVLAALVVEPVPDDENEDLTLPAAELVTAKGDLVRVKKRADAERLIGEVRALTAELAAAETPSPGPKSANGWEMFHVTGPAHVFMGGTPTSGVLDARMSTSGQYLCEFVATTDEGPIRATKSGWVTPAVASRAIDEVLTPFAEIGSNERRHATYATAMVGGAERRANAPSTAAVFLRFNHIQDALGDACLPELDPPNSQVGL